MVATYKSFIHVIRLDETKIDVQDYLRGNVTIFSKIDGTNALAWSDDKGEIHCGSRKREITAEHDNADFYLYFTTEQKYMNLRHWLREHPQYIVYGEWIGGFNGGRQIGTIKGYKKPGFWVIDVFDIDKGEYVPYDIYHKWLIPLYDQVESPLAQLHNPTLDEVKSYCDNHFNLPEIQLAEGIVIKNYAYRDRFGHFQMCKIVNEETRNHKGKVKTPVVRTGLEQNMVDAYVTDADIAKAQNKILIALGIEEWTGDNKQIGMLLNFVWTDLIQEELWSIIKKFKNPVIDFGVLRACSNNRVRKYLGFI